MMNVRSARHCLSTFAQGRRARRADGVAHQQSLKMAKDVCESGAEARLSTACGPRLFSLMLNTLKLLSLPTALSATMNIANMNTAKDC
jgi:hypothetical protein